MPGGQHKAITVEPVGIARIVLQELLPQHIGHGSGAERQAGMPRIRGLDSVHGKRADTVDGFFFKRLVDGGGGCQNDLLETDTSGVNPRLIGAFGVSPCVQHMGTAIAWTRWYPDPPDWYLVSHVETRQEDAASPHSSGAITETCRYV